MELNKFTEYTILKAVQVLALVTLPIIFYTQFTEPTWWCLFSAYVWGMYVRDFVTSHLENKYISDTL
jgi:RsiW-degrading membrane proteinase PrsW (M82 family)